ncbi:MAG TPA: PEP-CTERM sorting domain-containing protein [Burkholderiaceae bacterium]|nr:PEP-CTERM sorting domain-containing protein [Burkholderiaceae bacterium]
MSTSTRVICASRGRRPGWRPATLALAAAAALLPAAQAADYRWTGGAGSAASFWDLAANWTPGLPSGVDARALLGAYDTTLRSGTFDIGSVHGTGRMTFSGGTLRLNAPSSQLWALHLNGGTLQGPGTLNLTHLRWDSGSLGPIDPFEDPETRLVVTGNTTIGNGSDKYVGYRSTVELRGTTRWLDGNSAMTFDGHLHLGPGSRFEDHVGAGSSHGLRVAGGFVNAGTYVKTGAGTTSINAPYIGPLMDNSGVIRVQQGRLSVTGTPGTTWNQSGQLEVAQGATFSLGIFRGGFQHTGTALINGQAEFSVVATGISSTGNWTIGPTGQLHIINDYIYHLAQPSVFAAGTVRNDGVLRLIGGETEFRNGAVLTGRGRLELAEGAFLRSASPISLGSVKLDSLAHFDGFPYWGLLNAPSLSVQQLDWGVGDLQVSGRINVSAGARLHGGPQYWTGDGSGADVPGHRKQIDGTMVLGGGGSWTGETDIVGGGRVIVTPTRQFRDETARDMDPGGGTTRPVQLGVIAFENHGLYLKTGAGRTESTGRFYNPGRVLTQGSGQMIFSGTLNNPGTLEARGARIDVRGSLTQWNATERRLTAGTYIADRQVVALNLGSAAGITHNSARIELRGATAQLLNNHGGVDRQALSSLALNDGSLRLLSGASATTAALRNTGTVVVAGGGRLTSSGAYTHAGTSARTWIDGVMQASAYTFDGGLWGAGLDGTVGRASLLGGAVTLLGGQLDVDILGASLYDVVAIAGRARLGGTLYADFANGAGEGIYRVLTATGGLAGSFALMTDLDPTLYLVEARYGSTYVDLVVSRRASLASYEGLTSLPDHLMAIPTSPVPEPETYALMLAGLGMVAAYARKRKSSSAKPA